MARNRPSLVLALVATSYVRSSNHIVGSYIAIGSTKQLPRHRQEIRRAHCGNHVRFYEIQIRNKYDINNNGKMPKITLQSL